MKAEKHSDDDIFEDDEFAVDLTSEPAAAAVVAPSASRGMMGNLAAASESMQEGVWVPLLGNSGEEVTGSLLKVARINNTAYSERMSHLIRTYGTGKGMGIPAKRMRWAAPRLYAKTLLVSIRGVFIDDDGGSVVRKAPVLVTVTNSKQIVERVVDVHFDVDEKGEVRDTYKNRVNLLIAFPGLREQVWTRANDDSLFSGAEEDPDEASGKGSAPISDG